MYDTIATNYLFVKTENGSPKIDSETIEKSCKEIEMICKKQDVMCVLMEIVSERTEMIDRQIEILKLKNMSQKFLILKLNANIGNLK